MRTDRRYTAEADDETQVRYPLSIYTDEDTAVLEARRGYQKWKTMCPTCEDTGVYRWQDEDHECPVDFDNKCVQWKLFLMYEMSNISSHYMKLDWSDLGESKAKDDVEFYVEHLPNAIKRGYGLYLFSPEKGTGKTFCSTYILKEAAKLDTTKVKHRGYFVTFDDLLQAVTTRDAWLEDKMMHTNILAIDDIYAPNTEKQREMYPRVLEKIVRFRFSNDMPTLVSSNLTWEQFGEEYPRPHSVLSGCVDPVLLDYEQDYRIQQGVGRIFHAMKHGESPPIT